MKKNAITKSIQSTSVICSQISNFRNLSNEEVEEHLEELNHLCNLDGVVDSIIENNYHEELLKFLSLASSEIQRKLINILLKVVSSSMDSIKKFRLDALLSICDILTEDIDNLTKEMFLNLILEICKGSFSELTPYSILSKLINSLIYAIKWESFNIVYSCLYLFNLSPDNDNLVQKFMISNISQLTSMLRLGSMNEKMGILICKLFYRSVENIGSTDIPTILESNFVEILMNILFQSHLTISADYYLAAIRLLCKFLFLNNDFREIFSEKKQNYCMSVIFQRFQSSIMSFMLESLRRYNVRDISIYGFQVFYVSITCSKSLQNVLNETDQYNWIYFILETHLNSLGYSDVLIWSFRVLERIISLNTKLVSEIETKKYINDLRIDSIVIQVFYTQNALIPSSFCAACDLVSILSINSEKLQNRFLESQIHTIIHLMILRFFQRALNSNTQYEIRLSTGNAYRALILFNLPSKELFFNEESQYEDVKRFLLSDSLHSHVSGNFEEPICVNILLIAGLAEFNPIKYDLLQGKNFQLNKILDCETCSKSPLITEAIQEILIVLSGIKSETEFILNILNIEDWCEIASKFLNCYAIQKNTLIFLQLNCQKIDKIKQASIFQNIGKMIFRATNLFEQSLIIKTEACVLIQIIIKQFPDFVKYCINENLHTFLFETINLNYNEELVAVALQAFHVLTESNQTKEAILIKAINDGNLKLFQCMIAIGSDMSNISNELLLAAVKQKEKSLSASFITHLLHNGCRPSSYIINRCFDLNNTTASALLLRFYGIHESDKGHLINWSNLGMKHFHTFWIAKLSQELDIEIDGIIKWLSNKIKAESKNRILLRKLYDSNEAFQTKIFRYSTIPNRTLEKHIGGHKYYTIETLQIPTKTSPVQNNEKFNSFNVFKKELREKVNDCSLQFINEETESYQSSDETQQGDSRYIKSINKRKRENCTYKPIPREIDEFFCGFRCGTNYVCNALDPRCILNEKFARRFSKDIVTLNDFAESPLNVYVKIQTKNRKSRNSQLASMYGNYFSDSNSENGGEISQISQLDLSKNKLTNLEELYDISRDLKLKQMFQCVTSLKLESNSIKALNGTSFQIMESLEFLDLSKNYLKEIPWDIFKFCPLIHFNISKNKIKNFVLPSEMKEELKSYGKIQNLLQLYLSENTFKEFDINSLEIFTNLQTVEINSISVNISQMNSLPLPHLRKIYMKYNSLQSINKDFLKYSEDISLINFSDNQLSPIENTLQLDFANFENLVSLNLSHNNLACGKPHFIPKCVLNIPNLKTIDMSYNNITHFPSMWKSTSLNEIYFSHNLIQIFDLFNAQTSFSELKVVDLSHNLLKQISPDIGLLSKLTFLNISHNPNLTELPDEIGLLKNKNLNSLIRDGLKLNIPNYFNHKTQLREILKYYYNRLKKSIEYNGLRLMIIGFSGRGKTSLLYSLHGSKKPVEAPSTNIGINVTTWRLQNKTLDKISEYKFTCWDITGQTEIFCGHEWFLTKRALYLLLFDASREIEEVQMLKSWLWNLKSQAPNAALIIVGTHVDKLKESVRNSHCQFMKNSIIKLCLTPGFPKISDIVFIDSRNSNETINILKSKILHVLNKHQIQNEMLIEKQPSSYLKLEEILQDYLRSLSPPFPMMTEKEIKDLLSKNKLNLDNEEFKQAIQFLHDCGVLIHFDDTYLNNLYFLQPQWLCIMMANIITLRPLNTFIENGVMKLTDFVQIFKSAFNTKLPQGISMDMYTSQWLKILEKFDVIFQKSINEIIIPSKLPSNKPKGFPNNSNVSNITRIFEFSFLPSGFWPRLVARISILAQSFDELLDIYTLSLSLWKTGVIISVENTIYLILEGKQPIDKNGEIIELSVTKSELGIKFLVQLVNCIEVFIEEWYPGLTDTDLHGNRVMTIYALCPYCKIRIKLQDIVLKSKISDEMVCENCINMHGTVIQIPIRIIAPDIVLGDLSDDIIIKPDLLEVNKIEKNLIGSGGNGSVYKGHYNGIDCAVKYVDHMDNSIDSTSYRMLRQEIDILRRFQHPSLISFIAVDRERIVLELAPLKDLRHILSNYILSRRLLQRISYQVISGILHLHQNNIIYRDVKMQNVLVFSIELTSNINVKLADYGISRPVAAFGFVNPQGTPGYQAPEVIAKSISYELPADIYSFGILLYNIATRGHHPADNRNPWRAGMQTELLPPNLCDNWPRMQDCINICTKLSPEDRAHAKTISDFIASATFITIKYVRPLTKKTRIECMIVLVNPERKVEAFLSNGNNFEQEVRWLDISTGQSKGKPFLNDQMSNRILFMMLSDEFIYLGTQKGKLCLYNYVENDFISTPICFKDSILSMIMAKLDENLKILIVGLADGTVQYFFDFTSALNLTASDFTERRLSVTPVLNLYFANNQIFATCGSGIYHLTLKNQNRALEITMILQLDENKSDQLIKCFYPISEILNNKLVTSFYFTIRNESLIYNLDDQGNQLKPAIDCNELISRKMNTVKNNYSTRIMCLTIWGGDRYLAVGTGSGHLLIIDQKLDYIMVLSLFRNPIICLQHTNLSCNLRNENESSKSVSCSLMENSVLHDDPIKAPNINSGLIIVGNGYKTIDSTDFNGAVLIQISDDISSISRQLENHISSRNVYCKTNNNFK